MEPFATNASSAQGWPFDKSEVSVKANFSRAVPRHRCNCQRGWGPRPWKSHRESLCGGTVRSTNHRFGL